MGAYSVDYFTDSVPNGNTYMSQICNKIFTFNNSSMTSPELVAVVDSTCHDWFTQALEHCTEIVFFHKDTSIKTWILNQFRNLKHIIFPTRPPTSLANVLPHIKVNPHMLKKEECNHLFVEIARDYIDVAPKYSSCVEDSFFFFSIFKGLVCLLMIVLLYLYLRVLSSKSGKRFNFLKSQLNTTITPEKKLISAKMRQISTYSLKTQRLDRERLKVIPDLCDYPKIAIRVKKNAFSNALCCLIQSDPIIEKLKNGVRVKPLQKERRYVIHKLNGFLNKSAKCRVIIDINLDSSSESEEEDPKVPTKSSRGSCSTSTCENTADDSNVDTSSVCSGIFASKIKTFRPERHYFGKQRYLKSLDNTKIPTYSFAKKFTPCVSTVTEKTSSTSIALVDSKNRCNSINCTKDSANRGKKLKVSYL